MPAQLQHAPSSSSLHQAGGIQAARGVSALAEICAPPLPALLQWGEAVPSSGQGAQRPHRPTHRRLVMLAQG